MFFCRPWQFGSCLFISYTYIHFSLRCDWCCLVHCHVSVRMLPMSLFPTASFQHSYGYGGYEVCKYLRYIVTILMIWSLSKKTILSIPDIRSLRFGGYLRSGRYLFFLSDLAWFFYNLHHLINYYNLLSIEFFA